MGMNGAGEVVWAPGLRCRAREPRILFAARCEVTRVYEKIRYELIEAHVTLGQSCRSGGAGNGKGCRAVVREERVSQMEGEREWEREREPPGSVMPWRKVDRDSPSRS
eukprot:41924-Hanusia_phi.AAC.1